MRQFWNFIKLVMVGAVRTMFLAACIGITLWTVNVHAAAPGDVCGTANVDISDALCTLRYVVELIPHNTANDAIYLAADVAPFDTVSRMPKGNTTVDISDALGILRHVVNLDTWFNLSTALTGTAAAGAPIIGSVTIKDSTTPTARTKTVSIAADGKYTVDVSDMTAPYMVRADGYVGGNEYHLYSAGTSADVGGTINITPLTDLIVANVCGSIAQTYFDNGNFSSLTAAQLTAQSDALKAKLLPVLQAVGVSDTIDLLRASFSTDHSALDAALDVLRVTTDTTTGVATITNIITQQQMTSNATTGAYTGALTDTTGVAAGISDIQAISAGFKQFSDLFAASLPSDTNATLLSLFDSATFMFQGQSLAAFLSQITTQPSMIGISFTNISIQSMDTANGTAVVAFDLVQYGTVSNDGPQPFHMIKKAGKWYMQGDQYIAHFEAVPQAEYHVSDTVAPYSTGIRFSIEDRGGKGITSALVTGAGLPPGGLTLINNIANDEFEIQGQTNGNTYNMSDTAIGAMADTGEIYTVKLYIGTTLAATHTDKIKKRPYGNTELTPASFPTISPETLTQMQLFTGGNATISWTLPDGLTNDWLSAQINDSSGNSARAEFSLAPADRSKSFTLNPVTSTGQPFTITGGGIYLSAWDSNGRQLAVSTYGSSSNPPPPQNEPNVSIEGNVYASAGRINPIAGALVSTSLDSQTATTDAAGHFFLQTITPANYSTTPYTITVTKPGFPTFSQPWIWGDHPSGQTFNFDMTFGI